MTPEVNLVIQMYYPKRFPILEAQMKAMRYLVRKKPKEYSYLNTVGRIQCRHRGQTFQVIDFACPLDRRYRQVCEEYTDWRMV